MQQRSQVGADHDHRTENDQPRYRNDLNNRYDHHERHDRGTDDGRTHDRGSSDGRAHERCTGDSSAHLTADGYSHADCGEYL